MNKIIIALIVGAVVGIGLSPAVAETTSDLVNQITTLKKQVADKDAIIMEQIKVIMNIKDNYKVSYPDFDKSKYPATDGFPTEWLNGENAKIKANCLDEKADGYQSPWCKFVK